MLIVFNPLAGRRRAWRLWRVLDVLSAAGVRLEVAETGYPGHATELARSAARRGTSLVVAGGGDGTIAEIVNGIAGTDCRLGVIPLGTANVLAHELGLPFRREAVAAALAFGRTRTVWPGMVRGSTGTRLFVQMLGAGFDAQVVHRLPLQMKRLLGREAYVLQTLRELYRYRFRPIRLAIDGVPCEAASVIVSKGRYYAGRFLLAPGADLCLAGLTAVLFERAGPLAALACGAALPLDLLPRMPGLRLIRAHHIAIETAGVPVQTDGDPAAPTPLVVTDAPAPVAIVVA
jgi:YegS/Rv2252/BmrU family lipid kinase